MWPVAYITFLDGIRSRILFGTFLFAILTIFASLVFVHFFMHNLAKIAVDFNMASISFAGILIALSLTTTLISRDLETKQILFVLSKPISRYSYICGKFLGITLITLVIYFTLSLLATITLFVLTKLYPTNFSSFSWGAFYQCIFLDFIKISIFNSLVIFLSTVSTSSFVTMLFAIATYIIGKSLTTVAEYLNLNNNSFIAVPDNIKPFINILIYFLPNLSAFETKLLAAHSISLDIFQFLLLLFYGLSYISIMIFLAGFVFSKKEFS